MVNQSIVRAASKKNRVLLPAAVVGGGASASASSYLSVRFFLRVFAICAIGINVIQDFWGQGQMIRLITNDSDLMMRSSSVAMVDDNMEQHSTPPPPSNPSGANKITVIPVITKAPSQTPSSVSPRGPTTATRTTTTRSPTTTTTTTTTTTESQTLSLINTQEVKPRSLSSSSNNNQNHDDDGELLVLNFPNYREMFPIPDWMETFLQSQPTQTHHERLLDPEQKFLVVTCHKYGGDQVEECGGFSDRVKTLPYLLWVAKNSGRMLLIKYTKPMPLEEFLVPPKSNNNNNNSGFDWRLPDGCLDDEFRAYANRTKNEYKANRWRRWHLLIDQDRWKERRVIFANPNLSIGPVLKHFQNWTGMVHEDVFPGIFRRMFEPSPALARVISKTAQHHGLVAGRYAAAHLRIKFPVIPRLVWMNQRGHGDKEGGGLYMQSNLTTWNVHVLAHNAINCAMKIMPEADRIYYASDANESVDYLLHRSPWAYATNLTTTLPDGKKRLVPKIVTRLDYDTEPIHFDSASWHRNAKNASAITNQNADASAFYPMFVDLWIMAHAKCMSNGVGGFPRLAAELAGNFKTGSCRITSWRTKRGVQYCPEYLREQFGFDLEPRRVIPH